MAAKTQALRVDAASVVVNDIGGVSTIDEASPRRRCPRPRRSPPAPWASRSASWARRTSPAGAAPGGFDCSGLVSWAYARAGHPGLPALHGRSLDGGHAHRLHERARPRRPRLLRRPRPRRHVHRRRPVRRGAALGRRRQGLESRQPARLHRRRPHQRVAAPAEPSRRWEWPGGHGVGTRLPRPPRRRPQGACTLPRRVDWRHHGTDHGHGPVRQEAGRARSTSSPIRRRGTRSTSSPRPGACAASSAARPSSTPVTSRCCTRRDTCRSGTSRAPTCASTCSRRPSTRRTARSRATRSYWTIRVGRQGRREQGLGLPGDPAGDAAHHRSRRLLLGRRRALVRGGRGGLRPPARSVPPRRPRAELAHRARLAGRRRAGRVEPAAGVLRDGPAHALVPPQGGHRRLRADDTQHALPVQGHRVVLERGRQRRHRLELRGPDRRRRGAAAVSSRSTTRSSTSTSTASARSAATRPSRPRRSRIAASPRRSGATHSDEHRTGDARGHSRAPYRHRPRELPPRRP